MVRLISIDKFCNYLTYKQAESRRADKMEKRVRIADIAEELGVSTATVSNVIHGKTKKISDETVKRVQELLEKRQYIPSMAAILLSQNNSRIIGVVVNDHAKYEGKILEDGFISASLNALLPELEKAGYFMMVKVTSNWEEVIRFASMWNMDGFVLLGFCETDCVRLREKMHIPFVVYDGFFEKNDRICNLKIDDFDGGRQVGEYLYRMGHRRAILISDNDICMDRERMQGFRQGFGDGRADLWQVPMSREKRWCFYEQNIDIGIFRCLCSVGYLCGGGHSFPAGTWDICAGRYFGCGI